MQRRVTIMLMIWLCMAAAARAAEPKYEVRAVWLTTIGGLDWPKTYARSATTVERQKDELRTILDMLQRANINTVLIQTRIRGTVIYPSEYEPMDACFTGQRGGDPGYDPLQFAIDECHARGMELHAWVVTIPKGKKGKEEVYMDPADPKTGDYIAAICGEITENYDIDGIHLDYIRYPETWNFGQKKGKAKREVETDASRAAREQGRKNITDIVRKISNMVKGLKPWVKMSCAPVGKYNDLARVSSRGWNAYHRVCQDVRLWMKEGLMDAIFPMMYFKDDQFFPFALDWQENSYGRAVVPGLGIYMLNAKEGNWERDVIERQMHFLRDNGMGHAYFRSQFFTDNTKGVYDFIRDNIDRYPALVPPMTGTENEKPGKPTAFTVIRGTQYDILRWDSTDRNNEPDGNNNPDVYFNVYASEELPVDINDGRNLLRIRFSGNSLAVPKSAVGKELHYAVTAMNRYGAESDAATDPEDGVTTHYPLLTDSILRSFVMRDLPESAGTGKKSKKAAKKAKTAKAPKKAKASKASGQKQRNRR